MERIKLDLVPSCIKPVLHASQYDIGRQWRIELLNNGVPYVLQEGDVVEYEIRKGDGLVVTGSIAYIPGTSYIILVSTEQMCAVFGSNLGELTITSNGTKVGSVNFILEVERAPDEGGIESESEIKNLNRQIDEHIDEVLPDMVEEIAPAIVEEVAPSVVREIAPAVVREVAAPIVEELVPIAVGDNYYNKTQTDVLLNKLNTSLTEEIKNRVFKNIFNKDSAVKGYFITSTAVQSNPNYSISAPIYVKAGVTYKTNKATGMGTTVYYGKIKTDGTIQTSPEYSGTIDGDYEFYTFAENGFIVLNLGSGVFSNKIFIESNNFPNSFMPFYDSYHSKSADEAVKAERANITDQFVILPNLFNKNDTRIINGKFINAYSESSAVGYSITHPIAIKNGITYKMPAQTGYGTTVYMALCDQNGNISNRLAITKVDDFWTYTATADGYAMFNFRTENATNFMVCNSENYPETYSPYGYKLSDDVVDSSTEEINPLFGKKISFNGDSICYGAGYTGGYGKIIAEQNSMSYQNIGVSGATIAAGQTDGGGNATHCICNTVANMDIDSDYAILEGGVNDGESIGSISSGYTATLDDTTFAGAFESMLKQAISRFKGKKVGYIFVHKMTSTYSSEGDSNNKYYIAKRCCEKWGVPYCDLNTKCAPLGFVSELATLYTKNGDGWHPNEEGYKKYYVPQIEAWLKTL